MNEQRNVFARNFNGLQLLKFTFPTTIMMMFMGLYTIVDTLFVSNFVNTDALAAINIICPVINVTVGVGTMIATGGNAIVAKDMGQNQFQKAKENFTLFFIVGIIIGIVMEIIGFVWEDNILKMLGASNCLLPYAKVYFQIIVFFIPANILQTLFANLFVTAGKPGIGSVLSIGAGILNIILDYIFIVIFNMGIKGAALGTGISCLVPAVCGIIYFTVCRKGMLYFCKPKWQGRMLIKSCFNGSSEMVGQLATAITTLLFNLTMMNQLGENGVAAITIMIYAQFFFSTLYIGFSMGVSPLIGYNYGSGEFEKQKNIFYICLRFILSSSIIIFMISFLGGSILVRMFTGPENEVYYIAVNGFRIFSFSFLFSGFNIFTSAMFTALSNGKTSAILSFLRTFVFLITGILLFSKVFGVIGVWMAVPAAEACTFCISVYCVYKEYFNKKECENRN